MRTFTQVAFANISGSMKKGSLSPWTHFNASGKCTVPCLNDFTQNAFHTFSL